MRVLLRHSRHRGNVDWRGSARTGKWEVEGREKNPVGVGGCTRLRWSAAGVRSGSSTWIRYARALWAVSWLGLPWLAPIQNSCELRGLCYRSYFGPRTCGRGITIFIEVCGALNQGFPFSPLQCRQGRARMGGGVQVYAACWGGVVYCFCNYVTRHC